MKSQCWSTATLNEVISKGNTFCNLKLSKAIYIYNYIYIIYIHMHSTSVSTFSTSVCRLTLRMLVALATLFAGAGAIALQTRFWGKHGQNQWHSLTNGCPTLKGRVRSCNVLAWPKWQCWLTTPYKRLTALTCKEASPPKSKLIPSHILL